MKLGRYFNINTMRRYIKAREGATALEFGILVIPFSALLFGIIELAIVFFIGSSVSHATQEAAREIRTGQFHQTTTCKTAAAFKAEVCANMPGIGKCSTRLRIDVATSPTGRFQPDLLPETPSGGTANPNGEPSMEDDTYVNTPAQAVVVVRAQYFHKLAIPGELTFLSNQPGNYRVITAATAFRNEPFPENC